MKQYTNDYYDRYHAATTEAERSQIKADFEAVFATLTEIQKQEAKATLAKRIDQRIAQLKPIDEAIEKFNNYLNQQSQQPQPIEPISNAA